MSGVAALDLAQAVISSVGQSPVTLGSFNFLGNEVPSQISIGGTQTMAIHKLPGGGRIVDAMGPDESAIQWVGFFTGSFASDRARTLDGMRQSGTIFPLSFGNYIFQVIIARFDYILRDRGAVLQYRIRMEIIPQSPPQSTITNAAILTLLAADLASAVASLSLGGTTQSASAQAALLAVTPAVVGAGVGGSSVALGTALSDAGAAVSASIEAASAALLASGQSITVGTLTTTCDTAGALACCVQSAGYLNRANGFSNQFDGLEQTVPLIAA